jgi:predicted Rossmann fold nucleotide-binding protein DprA/Smf involved in DNA uptake
VESGESGGAIHQARFTAQQRRLLYCVSPDRNTEGTMDFNYGGGQRLVNEGLAKLIHSRADLMSIIYSGILEKTYKSLHAEGRLIG